ncbi:toxic anion resistance protein [Wohlfahrtiimonas chitiniclastica]|uniref:Toxic anion resistance protein n=1 Tax=Wohlfahrtiimonas chitiniclastica TaxID=400946 RepID=A0AB35BXI7_9GAMM|nr:toxic anion resistance protein [Wohlfahrtiimonas chitiniclastica]MBS7814025.1 toxic anion resistance protein [Wohlfahrtiimonas chitiniclastica]MBS7816288.1 toxic anion resistance protein [Wohlfahrtiimonas chitiniclastica]MBS7821717.1 toxic anion resistance protein [Wohlfahrtiimonas chitiniclastica]MBS7823925.1 toxic anion resistance protein [Wohlfahrtiimonas chitiniclastica]MBS7829509.1 toxic anion resistance protein [Wohlfahrtiimonas chitiniclastica]
MNETQNDQAIIVSEEKILNELAPNQAEITAISETININDPTQFLAYGSKPMAEIARFSDTLLNRVKTKDAGEVGNQLSNLVLKIREYDPFTKEEQATGFLANIPVIGGLFRKAEKVKIDHTNLTEQVDAIASHLDNSMVQLLRDNEQLELLYAKNLDYYRDLDLFIKAGQHHLENVRTHELPALEATANESKDLLDAQKVKDLMENINRFERRLHDLNLSKTIAMQTAPQIRIIQNNNQQLAEKIQGSIFSTLPVWKSQIVLSLSLQEQEKAAQLQKDVADTTNDLLRKNAEMLQQNSIATATEVERSIVDIETIRDVQNRLVNTIEETMKIATEAREKRKAVEIELSQMEDNLRERITSVVDKYQ